MNGMLLRSSWIFGIRGAAALLFGILALIWPGLTMLTLVALFAAYALISGVAATIGAFRNRTMDDNWWMFLVLGLVGIGAAILTVLHPALTMLVLVLIMGATALVFGVLDIAAAIRLRKTIKDEWLLTLSGAAAILFGVLVFLFPTAGALALVWMISLYALITGIFLLAVAWKIYSALKATTPSTAASTERRMAERRGGFAGAH